MASLAERPAERRAHRVPDPWNQSVAARPAGQVDAEQLQHEQDAHRRRLRQHHLAVAVRVQRVAMMVGVAERVVIGIEPGDQREQAQKEPVQRLGAEHGAVIELVRRRAQKAGVGPVREQRDGERHPLLPCEEVVGHQGGAGQVADHPQRLPPALQIAAPHELPQQPRVDGAPIPLDAQRTAHVGQRKTHSAHNNQRLQPGAPAVKWLRAGRSWRHSWCAHGSARSIVSRWSGLMPVTVEVAPSGQVTVSVSGPVSAGSPKWTRAGSLDR